MGLAYLFALVVGMGILMFQAVMGSKDTDGDADGDADGDFHAHADGDLHADADCDVHADADGDFHADADGDLDADADFDGHDNPDFQAHGDAGDGKDVEVGGAFVALFLSTRFWIFASLGFGLSGTLLTYLFTGVSPIAAAVTAVFAGVASGLSAALAFRALKRTASRTTPHARSAVGSVGKVIVPCSKEGLGKVRIEIEGQSVDLLAKTGELRIERGDFIVVEEVEGEIAQVSKAPPELHR
jgi:membrane protein implicated in regulation of membrane protease activity